MFAKPAAAYPPGSPRRPNPVRLVDVLASEVGLDITLADLYSESLGKPDSPAGTHLAMMRYNATTIIAARCDEG